MSKPKTFALKKLLIRELSLCGAGMNPGASVVIAKAAPAFKPCPDCQTPEKCTSMGKCQRDVNKAAVAASEIEKMSKELEAELARLEGEFSVVKKSLDEKDAALAAKDAQIQSLTAELAKAKEQPQTPEAIEKAMLDAMPAPARAQFVQTRELLAKAQADLQAAQSLRETETAINKARGYGYGDPNAVGPIMLRVAKGKATAEDVAAIEQLLTGAGALVGKSKVFGMIGSASPAAGSPEDAIVAKAAEIRKANPKLTDAQAYVQAMEQNPDLYAQAVGVR